MKKVISCSLVGTILLFSLFGCAVQCYPPGSECRQRQANLNQTTAEGALIGAAVGLGAAALIKPNRLAVGALAGALAGGVTGNMVGQKQDRYYTRKSTLEKEIKELKEQNKALYEYNQALRVEIERLERRIEEIKATITGRREQLKQLQYEKKDLQRRAMDDHNQIHKLKRSLNSYSRNLKAKGNGFQSPEVDAEIDRLNSGISVYETLWKKFISLTI